jgi:transcriptional regulator of arginine metabolism
MSSGNDALKLAVLQLLYCGQIGTQAALIAALKAQGVVVNQAKVSRVLRQLGAIKMMQISGRMIYIVPQEIPPPATETEVARMVLQIEHNDSLVVVRTAPGAAALVAHLLDHQHKVLRIIGVIAGDDTVFLAPRARVPLVEVVREVRGFLLKNKSIALASKVH